MFLDQVGFVATLQPIPGNADKEVYTTYSGFLGPQGIRTAAIPINIQPADLQLVALTDGVVGKTFKGFTTASGVVDGMRITVSGTNERYIVQGRGEYNFVLDTYELILSKGDR